MLEQTEFRDDYGVRWLNRPGPSHGVSLMWFWFSGLISAIIPSLVIGLPVWGWLVLSAFISVLFIGGAMIVKTGWNARQCCPQCQNYQWRGFNQCRGCGYPYAWSSQPL